MVLHGITPNQVHCLQTLVLQFIHPTTRYHRIYINAVVTPAVD